MQKTDNITDKSPLSSLPESS